MGKYRKKPVVIEAWQWKGKTLGDAKNFQEEFGLPMWYLGHRKNRGTGMIIPTLEGDHVAQANDWIIKGVQGEYYPCKPDIFEATYDKVEDG